MRYDISKTTAPKMPALDKGTECIKILLSQVSKDNYEPFVPMFFPVLGAQEKEGDRGASFFLKFLNLLPHCHRFPETPCLWAKRSGSKVAAGGSKMKELP